MNVRTRVIRDTTDHIGNMPELLDEGLENIAGIAMERMIERAKDEVPRDTRQLLGMIIGDVRRIGAGDDPAFQAIVGVPLGPEGYGAFVEFGTGQAGIISHAMWSRQYMWPHIDYKRSWHGMGAQPYLTPQPFAVKDEVDDRVVALLVDTWNGGPG